MKNGIKAKKYLTQIKKIDICINQKIAESRKLDFELKRGLKPIDYTMEKVQTSTKFTFENLVNKKIDLENEINNEIDRFIDTKHIIINQIQSLENSDQIAVLYKRYIQYKSIVKISREMYYCLSHINRLHQLGLLEFEKKYSTFL